MKKVIVAVDGSPASNKGLELAVGIAAPAGLRLELVNVQPPVLLAPSVYADTIRVIEAAHAKASSEVLEAARQFVLKLATLEVLTTSLVGPPGEAIALHAHGDDVWGVVVGAKGHSAVARVLLGSVADRLVHLCTCPVLVVR